MSIQAPPTTSVASSPKSVSFSSALAVTNAVKTSIATAATPQVYTGVALNGSLAGGPYSAPRTITVTTSTHAGSYVLAGITIKGTDAAGNALQDTLTLTQVNGNETVVGVQGFLTVTEIDVPAQNDALGTFIFGVQDVAMTFRRVRCGGAGNVHYRCQLDRSSDTIPSVTAGETLAICGDRLFGDATTTATLITLYY